jgi:membrane AbrB-like protein
MTGPKSLNGLAGWVILAAASLVVALGFEEARLPASFLIGPLIAGIGVRLVGIELAVPRRVFLASQAVVGAMLGTALTPSIVATFRHEWPILLGAVALMVATATFLGWALSRFGVVPGTTGVWGSSPGAASAMVVQAAHHGADVQLVAFMQYVRVLFVASTASVAARIFIGVDAMPPPPVLFPTIHPGPFALTIALVVVLGVLGVLSRVPSGAMLGPLIVGAVLHGSDTFAMELPTWLLVAAYTGLGWTIGLGFTRAAVVHAARALPWIAASIVVLMAVSAVVALELHDRLGIDPLTAWLATSPGGMDTIAVIAASTPVDVSFVLALQAVRFFVLVAIGPALSRMVARTLERG